MSRSSQMLELQMEIADLQAQKSQNQRYHDELVKRVQMSEQKYVESKKIVISLKRENEEMKKHLQGQAKMNNPAQNDDSTVSNDSLKSSMKRKELQVDELTNMVNHMHSELQGATASFARMEKQKLEMKEAHDRAVKKLLSEMMEAERKFKLERDKIELGKREIEMEKDALKSRLETQDAEINKFDQLATEREMKLKMVEEEMKSLLSCNKADTERHSEQHRNYIDKISLLTKSLEDKELIIRKLSDECGRLKKTITNISANEDSIKYRLSTLEKENFNLRQLNTERTTAINSLNNMKKIHENTIASFNSMQMNMNLQLRAIEDVSSSLTSGSFISSATTNSSVDANYQHHFDETSKGDGGVPVSVSSSLNDEFNNAFPCSVNRHQGSSKVGILELDTSAVHTTVSKTSSMESEFTFSPVSKTNWSEEDLTPTASESSLDKRNKAAKSSQSKASENTVTANHNRSEAKIPLKHTKVNVNKSFGVNSKSQKTKVDTLTATSNGKENEKALLNQKDDGQRSDLSKRRFGLNLLKKSSKYDTEKYHVTQKPCNNENTPVRKNVVTADDLSFRNSDWVNFDA